MVILDENSSGVWVWDIAILENFPVDLDSFLSSDIQGIWDAWIIRLHSQDTCD